MAASGTQFIDLYTSATYRSVLPERSFAEGFIFAVAACPEIPMPETWMPWLVQGNRESHPSLSMDTLAEGLMHALRETLGKMRGEIGCMPQAYLRLQENGEVASDLEKWLTGLLAAHKQLEPCWQRAWTLAAELDKSTSTDKQEAPEKRLRRCLSLFSTLADVELALSMRNEENATQLKEHMPALVKQIPSMLKEYIALAGELAAVLPNQFETFVKNQ